ncbi:hypothetical protein AWW66_08725 [Micromonospora rosaria]|uniref:Right handed beta helix domain-containing protein n=1 Tax=Micromonospora rosaria TaxID=47874 RepID=A0A136PVI7_9ACTN|nr:hypothetical protein [Micromonospora rosaria]KXK62405.1 hypothetical protein AWW66_08725 [Micromonospora rosaria]
MSTLHRSHDGRGQPRARTRRRRLLAGGLVAGSLVAGATGLTGVAGPPGGTDLFGPVLAGSSSVALNPGAVRATGTPRDGDTDRAEPSPPSRPTTQGDRPAGVTLDVPCDPARLIAALVHLDAQGGGVLRLASSCTYVLTEAAADDDRFDGGVRDARETADRLENGENATNTDKSRAELRRENSSGLPVVYHPIEIRGAGATIARDPNAAEFRFFTVRDGGELKLSDVTLRNGRSVAEGGSVHVVHGGSAVLDGVTVTDSVSFSAEGGGGAVFNDGNLVVTDSTFTRNVAAAKTGRGGALLNGGVLTVTGSTFADNRAASTGGGFANFRGAAEVGDSTFRQNQAAQGGGIASFSARTRVWDTEVVGNTAEVGGGVANADATLALRGMTVRDNVATRNGGGISAVKGLLTLDESVVRANVARGNGGGLYVEQSNVPVRRTEVSGNGAVGATSAGGGIHATSGQVSLFASQVTGNRAVRNPGGVHANKLRAAVDDESVIARNQPTNCEGSPTSVGSCFR